MRGKKPPVLRMGVLGVMDAIFDRQHRLVAQRRYRLAAKRSELAGLIGVFIGALEP